MVVPMFRTPGFRSSGTAVPPHKNIQGGGLTSVAHLSIYGQGKGAGG